MAFEDKIINDDIILATNEDKPHLINSFYSILGTTRFFSLVVTQGKVLFILFALEDLIILFRKKCVSCLMKCSRIGMNSLYNISFGFLFHFIFSLMIAMVFVDIEQGIHSLGKT